VASLLLPTAPWNVAATMALCRALGVAWHGPRVARLHGTVSSISPPALLTIPTERPIKPVYIRRLIGLHLPADVVDEVRGRAVRVMQLLPGDGGGFLASVGGLPGCWSDGDTAEEARDRLTDAMIEWRARAEVMGWPAPPPRPWLVTRES
jgi:hypothetical protein